MNVQQVKSTTPPKKIVIFSGGTMVHVRPHFSLCAPAYGLIGEVIQEQFWHDREVVGKYRDQGLQDYHPCDYLKLEQSRMAGGSAFETNEDLSNLVDKHLADPTVGCIIMAAAICDFEPTLICSMGDGGFWSDIIGKDKPRLSSAKRVEMVLSPADKIIDHIKKQRPDMFLVTFKTTSGLDEDAMAERAHENLERSKSDIVFANDIKNRTNAFCSEELTFGGSRKRCISEVVDHVVKNVLFKN